MNAKQLQSFVMDQPVKLGFFYGVVVGTYSESRPWVSVRTFADSANTAVQPGRQVIVPATWEEMPFRVK